MRERPVGFKKSLILPVIFLAALALPSSLFAELNLFGGKLRFTPVAGDTLFKEYKADPYSLSSGLKFLWAQDRESVPTTILASDGTRYIKIPFTYYNPDEFESRRTYWQIKGFVNLHVARIRLFDILAAEADLSGGINSVFQAFGGTDTLGFDGIWRLAGTLRFFDIVAIRYGTHHFSGHWGDETIADLPKPGAPDYIPYHTLEEYVRGNSRVLGFSFDPAPFLRVYCEAELPEKATWLRPGIHVPAGLITPDGRDLLIHMLAQEGLLEEFEAYDGSYQAWRLQTGAELTLPLGKWGSLFAAGDFQLHQDGQTLHNVGLYDKDNPWEQEYTVGGGFEYGQGFAGRKIRIEAYYHDGRFPLTNYFYQRSRYISLGIAINN